jgi:hypothetical protein
MVICVFMYFVFIMHIFLFSLKVKSYFILILFGDSA